MGKKDNGSGGKGNRMNGGNQRKTTPQKSGQGRRKGAVDEIEMEALKGMTTWRDYNRMILKGTTKMVGQKWIDEGNNSLLYDEDKVVIAKWMGKD
jgi:hypothetical protein